MNIRKNKGITLTALVIMVVLLLIISGISITGTLRGHEETKEASQISELNMIQHAILERYTKAQLTKETLPGIVIDIAEVKTKVNDINNKISDENKINLRGRADEYKKLDETNLKKLGVTKTKDEYIVNYSTGEVLNISKEVTKSGKALYTYSKESQYENSGLILHYDGINNTGSGHSSNSTVWKDLSGNGNDASLIGFENTTNSGFIENGLVCNGENNFFQTADVNLKQNSSLTVDMTFKENSFREMDNGNNQIILMADCGWNGFVFHTWYPAGRK